VVQDKQVLRRIVPRHNKTPDVRPVALMRSRCTEVQLRLTAHQGTTGSFLSGSTKYAAWMPTSRSSDHELQNYLSLLVNLQDERKYSIDAMVAYDPAVDLPVEKYVPKLSDFIRKIANDSHARVELLEKATCP
jgi:hypothetical protein